MKLADVDDPASGEAMEAILDGLKHHRQTIGLTSDQKRAVAYALSSDPECLPELRQAVERREVGLSPQTSTNEGLRDFR